jgi:carbon-monoxide dehydrogenase small subunit
MISVTCRVNGADTTLQGHPMGQLLDALRTQLQLTGIKEGCGEGECGACSILLDGRLVNSCLVPLLQADGSVIVTIEGVAQGDRLHAVQEAFILFGGAQCGICTPGMILAAVNLLERTPTPGEQEVREALAGNLCRCTGYVRIFEAVLDACRRTADSSACGPREESESSSAAARASGGGAPRA